MIPTYVVIPFLGQLEMTENLVRQLAEQDDTTGIILCNNGPVEDLRSWMDDHSYGSISLTLTNQNIYRMMNAGILAAMESLTQFWWGAKCNIAILNNDLELVDDHYIRRMADALRSSDEVGLVTGTELRWTCGLEWEIARYNGGLQGNAVMIRGELPFRFDDRFVWWYGDNDLGAQIENTGYRCLLARRATHIHLGGGSVTTRAQSAEWQAEYHAQCQRDRQLFHTKWPQADDFGVLPEKYLVPRG